MLTRPADFCRPSTLLWTPKSGFPPPEPSVWLWRTVMLASALLVLVPLLLTDVPPLLDYPSHLGRLTVLVAADHDLVRQIWTPKWSPIPNLAMDVVVLGLARQVSLHLAGKIFVAFALLMPALGAITLHRALYRRRSWWPVGSFAVAYNGILLAGFLNFLFGLGLALLGAALWVRWIERPAALRASAAAALAIPIYFSHLTALFFFVTLIASIEFWVALRRGQVRALTICGRGDSAASAGLSRLRQADD